MLLSQFVLPSPSPTVSFLSYHEASVWYNMKSTGSELKRWLNCPSKCYLPHRVEVQTRLEWGKGFEGCVCTCSFLEAMHPGGLVPAGPGAEGKCLRSPGPLDSPL